MGERAPIIMRAFDGRAVDWTAMLGAGFHSAPKGHVSVFRESSREELLRIAREGLSVPPPEIRHPEMRQEMELLDRHRPAEFVEQGISRLNAIYAVPTSETPRLPFRKEYFILEMKVDPNEAFVGDMDFVTCLIPFIGAHRASLDKYGGAFTKYWESVISLKDFFKHYKRVETGDGTHWVAKPGAPKRFLKTYFAPEIMVMTPLISQRHMRIVRREDATYDDDGCEHVHEDEPQTTWEDK
jgi:hypothetical protein